MAVNFPFSMRTTWLAATVPVSGFTKLPIFNAVTCAFKRLTTSSMNGMIIFLMATDCNVCSVHGSQDSQMGFVSSGGDPVHSFWTRPYQSGVCEGAGVEFSRDS